MSSGTNWTGGRGKRAKHGLKILEHTPEQHFAKRRALMTQDRSQQEPILNVLSSVAFKHAQKHIMHRELLRGTAEPEPTCANSTLPRALSRPNKPVVQPQLSGLVGKAIQNVESLDAKRAQINAVDSKSLAGLDNLQKRKYSAFSESAEPKDPVQKHYNKPRMKQYDNFPTQGKPRAFIPSPSPETPEIEHLENSEEMLSFGTPSDQHSMTGTQISTLINSEDVAPGSQVTDQDQTIASQSTQASITESKEADAPIMSPNLYEDAVRAAAQVLNLPNDLSPFVYGGASNRVGSELRQDDTEIRAFNLFAASPIDVLAGIPTKRELRITLTPLEGYPKDRLSDRSNAGESGNYSGQERLTQERQVQVQRMETQDNSTITLETHAEPGREATDANQLKRSREAHGRWLVPPGPFDGYVDTSHCDKSQRSWDQEPISSGVLATYASVVQGIPKSGGSNALAKFEEYSAGSGESCHSSQESHISQEGSFNDHRKIGLNLFSDHSDAEMGT